MRICFKMRKFFFPIQDNIVHLQRKVCHDDEMTLGSGSFSGISQQLPKRW